MIVPGRGRRNPVIVLRVVLLPAPVRPDQGDDFPLLYGNRDPVEGVDVPVEGVNPVHYKVGHTRIT